MSVNKFNKGDRVIVGIWSAPPGYNTDDNLPASKCQYPAEIVSHVDKVDLHGDRYTVTLIDPYPPQLVEVWVDNIKLDDAYYRDLKINQLINEKS